MSDKIRINGLEGATAALQTLHVECEATGKTYVVLSYMLQGSTVQFLKLDEYKTPTSPSDSE